MSCKSFEAKEGSRPFYCANLTYVLDHKKWGRFLVTSVLFCVLFFFCFFLFLGWGALHHWLDVFTSSWPPCGGSNEKAAALPHPLEGGQKVHCGVHVWTQGSPHRGHTGNLASVHNASFIFSFEYFESRSVFNVCHVALFLDGQKGWILN